MARPREFEEGPVLEAVRERFWDNGYMATTMGDLSAATGLGKGSLYAAFGDKRSLFGRVLDAYCADAIAEAHKTLDGPDAAALGNLRAYVMEYAAKSSTGKYRRGCLLQKSASELASIDAAVRKRALSTYQALRDEIATCIRAAQRNGDIAATTDADQAAALVFAMLRGLEALGKAGMASTEVCSIAEHLLDALSADRVVAAPK